MVSEVYMYTLVVSEGYMDTLLVSAVYVWCTSTLIGDRGVHLHLSGE